MDFLHETAGLKPYQVDLLLSFITILVLWLARNIMVRIIMRRTDDVRTRYAWQKTSGYVATFIGLIIIIRIWFLGNLSLSTFIGFLSAGIAIALKDMLTNVAGWIFIIWARPLDVGGPCSDR